MCVIQKGKYLWLLMPAFILSSNFMLYQTSIGVNILPPEANLVVLGSLIDLIIMGIQKEYSKIAIKSDNPERLKAIILNKINHEA